MTAENRRPKKLWPTLAVMGWMAIAGVAALAGRQDAKPENASPKSAPKGTLMVAAPAGKKLGREVPMVAGRKANAIIVGPYLQSVSRDSITICWETDQPGDSTVEYQDAAGKKQVAFSPDVRTLHEVTLKGLATYRTYSYRVHTANDQAPPISSDVYAFTTAVSESDPFTFCVVGDTQYNPKEWRRVAAQIRDRRPHFAIVVGDLVDNGPRKNEWVNEFFAPAKALFHHTPFLAAIGNHEQNHPYYYRYISAPAPEYYFAYQFGAVDFFVIDSNKKLHPESEQYRWLDNALAASKARWKIVCHHHPAYSSDDNDFGDTWRDVSAGGTTNLKALTKLYDKHGVDINFNGHVHVYERTYPIRDGKLDEKGTVYVTCGGGGGPLENFSPTPTWFKAECRSVHHYCHVAVNGRTLSCKAFDADGRLFDVFQLTK